MKKNYLTIAISLLSITYFVSSCKKKESSPTVEETPIVVPPVNKLCDGNGSNLYYPIDSANSWTYKYKISGVTQSISPNPKVIGHITYLSKKYSKIKDAISFSSEFYLRTEITNNNVYRYDSGTSSEFLEIPGAPILNQTWTSYSGTSTVTNLSASITTSACSYTGLLEISVVSSISTIKYYYKKGLGLVYSIESGSTWGNDEYSLTSTILK